MREGTFDGGVPYLAIGGGEPLIYFQGLAFEHANPTGLARAAVIRSVRPFATGGYTVYWTSRRPGLTVGTTMSDLARELALALQQHFGSPVSILGHSTGGSLALQLGVEHSDVIKKLVVASAAYELGSVARKAQMEWVRGLAEGQNRAYVLANGFSRNPVIIPLMMAGLWVSGLFVKPPKGAPDMLATAVAEDEFNVRERLAQISVPTLVICGARDHFYEPEMFRETAHGIPNSKLIMYPSRGHAIQVTPDFYRDVLNFLNQ